MQNELIMLGTGHAMVTKCYNTCFIIRHGNEPFLIDAGGGNGILGQVEHAGIPWQDIHKMFLTHTHTDHIFGAVWVIRKIASLLQEGRYHGIFDLYCHEDAANALKEICRMTLPEKFTKYIGKDIEIHKVKDGEHARINGMELTFFDIFSKKAPQFGFQAIFSDGTKFTCLGDEPYNEHCSHYVFGSDWLLCEAFCLHEERERFHPYERFHSTAQDAGRLAQKLQVKNLLLYHTEDTALAQRKERYTKEAAEEFGGNIFVPDDLEVIPLGK